MAINPDQYTISYDQLIKNTTMRDRMSMAQENNTFYSQLVQALTPTQLANLFPRYYRDRLPDIGGFNLATSQIAAGTFGKGLPTSTITSEAGSGYVSEKKTKTKKELGGSENVGKVDKKKLLDSLPKDISSAFDEITKSNKARSYAPGNDPLANLSDAELKAAGLKRTSLGKEGGNVYTKATMSPEQAKKYITDRYVNTGKEVAGFEFKNPIVKYGAGPYYQKHGAGMGNKKDNARIQTEIANYIAKRGKEQGYTDAAIKGMVANAFAESHLGLLPYGDNGASGGVFHLNKNGAGHGHDIASMHVNSSNSTVDEYITKMKESVDISLEQISKDKAYASLHETLKTTDDVGAATDAFLKDYERPKVKNFTERREIAAMEEISGAKLGEVKKGTEYNRLLQDVLDGSIPMEDLPKYAASLQTEQERVDLKAELAKALQEKNVTGPTAERANKAAAVNGVFDINSANAYTAESLIEQGISPKFAKNIAAKLNTLDPSIQHRYANAMVGLYKTYGDEGYEFNIDTAYRSIEEQAALKTTGRKASPGGSWHNYRAAIDIQTYKNGRYDDGTGRSGESPYIDKVWPVVQDYGIKGGFTDDAGHLIPSEFSNSVPKAIRRGDQKVSETVSREFPGDVPVEEPPKTATNEIEDKVPNLAAGGVMDSPQSDNLHIGPKPDLSADQVKSMAAYNADDQGVYDDKGNLILTKKKEETVQKTKDNKLKISSSEELKSYLAEGGTKYTKDQLLAAGFPDTRLTKGTVDKLNSLHPEVRDRYFNMLVDAQKDIMNRVKSGELSGVTQIGISQGARSAEDQEKIKSSIKGAAADVGRSWHNYNLAADFVLTDGKKIVQDPYYETGLREIGAKHGLSNLIKNDAGHFQMTGLGSLAKTEKGRGVYEFSPVREDLFSAYSKGDYENVPETVSTAILKAEKHQERLRHEARVLDRTPPSAVAVAPEEKRPARDILPTNVTEQGSDTDKSVQDSLNTKPLEAPVNQAKMSTGAYQGSNLSTIPSSQGVVDYSPSAQRALGQNRYVDNHGYHGAPRTIYAQN